MFMTANPCADAERWTNQQDRREAQAEALEIEAGRIVLAELSNLKPTDWHRDIVSGPRPFSPDELLAEALEVDDDTRTAMDILMACTYPEVRRVIECAGLVHAKAFWRDIVGSRANDV
ncbi:hypothetical protein [Comamonas sp. NoAH]|uniref:hypothetical protein n=1 Tax=Comamonas halotolerans TaxID=3041496 RepID=UPI0024E0BA43|nr:hypothetical protein [Comamonas sp. NoAH]